MKNLNIITAILVIVVGAASFFGGMKYAQSQLPQRSVNRQFQNGRPVGNPQARAGFRPVMGEIIASDDKSITVKLTDGSSKIVLLPQTVTISKTDTGAKTDLKIGVKVGVFGSDNADGSLTASNIQLNPVFRLNQASPSGSSN